MFREGDAAQCLVSFFEHLSKRSLDHEIIDQLKRIVSTSSFSSDTTTVPVTVTDARLAREFWVREEKGSAAGSASPEAGACVSHLVPISRQVSGSKCAAVHAGRTVTRIALARRWHVNDVQTAIPAPRQLRILGQLANWRYWASCIESGSFAVGCVQRHTSRGRTALLCAQTKWRTDKVAWTCTPGVPLPNESLLQQVFQSYTNEPPETP